MAGKRVSLRKNVFIRLLIMTVAAVLLFYCIGLAINYIGINNVRTQIVNLTNANAQYMATELERDVSNLSFFCREISNNKSLTRYVLLSESLSPYQRTFYIQNIYDLSYQMRRFSPIAAQVRIMMPIQNRCVSTAEDMFDELDQEELDAFYSLSKANTTNVVEKDGDLWLTLPRTEQNHLLVMITVRITKDLLLSRLTDIARDENSAIVLLREDGSVLWGTQEGLTALEKTRAGNAGPNLCLAESRVTSMNLTLVSFDRIDTEMTPFVNYRTTLWLLSLLSLGMLVLYLVYYRVRILRPVDDMLNTIINLEADTQYRVRTDTHSEFDDIYAEFNHMVEHIETLASKVYEESYRAQQAELKQLQMEIDPHFLFNSLYLIYRIARSDGNQSIADLSLNLSNYYRYITRMPQQIVELKDEIAHVMNYMEIQQFRFRPRITIDVQPLPETIAHEHIPSLIIQPIVQNAFQHGVKDMTSGGVVSIRYEETDTEFRVIVADNSGLMTEERVREIWEKIRDKDTPDSNALRNLYRRLQLYQGESHGLELKCVSGGLTAILMFRRGGIHLEADSDRG